MDTHHEPLGDQEGRAESNLFSRVLVVIPALNEESHIEKCILSLLDGTVETKAVRLAVVDGLSSDRTQDIVRSLMAHHPNLHLIENPKRIQSAAINLAVDTLARPEDLYLVRCDAHADYPPDYIKKVVTRLRDTECASVASVMDSMGDTCFGKAAAWAVDTKIGSGGSGHRGGQASGFVSHGHHAGMRLDWFRKIGGYDPDKCFNEDAEYDVRLTRAGGRIWLDSEIRMDYKMRGTPKALWKQYVIHGTGRAETTVTHNLRPQLRQLVPVLNLLVLVSSFILALAHPVFLLWPFVYFSCLIGISLWSAFTQRNGCYLWSGIALGIMHQAWAFGFVRQFVRSLRGIPAR